MEWKDRIPDAVAILRTLREPDAQMGRIREKLVNFIDEHATAVGPEHPDIAQARRILGKLPKVQAPAPPGPGLPSADEPTPMQIDTSELPSPIGRAILSANDFASRAIVHPVDTFRGKGSATMREGMRGVNENIPFANRAVEAIGGPPDATAAPGARSFGSIAGMPASTMALSGPAMLLGKGVRAAGRATLASKGARAAQAVEAGSGLTAPTAQELEAAKAQYDSVIAQGYEQLAPKVPEIAEILRKPAELEARLRAANAAEKGAELLRPKLMPSTHSLAVAAGMGGFGHGKFAPLAIAADLMRANAAPIAGKLAPAARAIAGRAPLPSGPANALFQAALAREGQ